MPLKLPVRRKRLLLPLSVRLLRLPPKRSKLKLKRRPVLAISALLLRLKNQRMKLTLNPMLKRRRRKPQPRRRRLRPQKLPKKRRRPKQRKKLRLPKRRPRLKKLKQRRRRKLRMKPKKKPRRLPMMPRKRLLLQKLKPNQRRLLTKLTTMMTQVEVIPPQNQRMRMFSFMMTPFCSLIQPLRRTPSTHTGWTDLVDITLILEMSQTDSKLKLMTSLWRACTKTTPPRV